MLKVSSYCRIRFDDPLYCYLPLDRNRVELRDPRYVELISTILGPVSYDGAVDYAQRVFGISQHDAQTVIADLVREGILVGEPSSDPRDQAIAHWVQRGWLDALHMHAVSRDIAFDDDNPENLQELHDALFASLTQREAPPPFWKEYHGRAQIALPTGESIPENRSFEQVVLARRSNQSWSATTISLERVSAILRSANAATRRLRMHAESHWKKVPSTLLQSAFCATETYVFAFSVDGLEPGLYHYDPRNSLLTLLRQGNLRADFIRICAGQERPGTATCAFAITGVFERYMYRYRHPRGYRTLLINVAELAQKYLLVATTFGLSTFLTPLFVDEVADSVLEIDGYEEALLEVVAIG